MAIPAIIQIDLNERGLDRNFILTALDKEKQRLKDSLERRVGCCCIPYTGVKNWTYQHISLLKFRTRLIVRCAAPIIMYSLCISIIVATALNLDSSSENDLDSLVRFPLISAGVLMSLYFLVHSCTLAFRSDEGIIPSVLFKSLLGRQIKNEIENLTHHQSRINQSETVDLVKLARLMASIPLSPSVTNEILARANVLEFKTMLKEMTIVGAPPQLLEPQELLHRLIDDPPLDPIRYREIVLRIIDLLTTDADCHELSLSLPLGDPRRQILPTSQEIWDAASAESSSSPDFVVIDIPQQNANGTISVMVGDTCIPVDRELLRRKSGWFAIFFRGEWGVPDSSIVLSEDTPHCEVLIEILLSLSRITSLWSPFKAVKKIEYLELFDCLECYVFIEELHALAQLLVREGILSSDEKFDIVSRVITSENISTEILDYWWNDCFTGLKNVRDMPASDTYQDTLGFGLRYYRDKVVVLYTEYLLTVTDYYHSATIKGVVRHREKLVKAETVINDAICGELVNGNFRTLEFQEDGVFLEWLGRLLQRSDNLIGVNNFKSLWPLATENELIKSALIRFASRNKLEVIKLWDIGAVPADLMSALPH